MRYDKATGLYMPDLPASQRRELRTRAYELLQRHAENKASKADWRELEGIHRTLYGEGSGWEGRAETDPRMAQMLAALKRRGVVTTAQAVQRGTGAGGEFEEV